MLKCSDSSKKTDTAKGGINWIVVDINNPNLTLYAQEHGKIGVHFFYSQHNG